MNAKGRTGPIGPIKRDELDAMTRRHALADRLLSIRDLRAALKDVLETAVSLFRADKGTVQIRDPERNTLEYAAVIGFDEKKLAAIPPIDEDFHSSCAVALRTGSRVIAADIAGDAEWKDHAETAAALDYAAAFSFPMKTRGEELQGILSVQFRKPRSASNDEVRWGDLLARLGAHLVERERVEAALRDSERRATTLAAELQHRVRNVLAMIRSMIGRAGVNKSDVDDLVNHLQGRISAMARTQVILTRAPGEKVDLEEILHDEMLASASVNGNLKMQGKPVALSPRAAEVLTLAIHELATNSLKYGALGNHGSLAVRWSVKSRNGADWLTLTWKESGVSIGQLNPKPGFGTELVTRRVPYELGGDAEIKFRPDGIEAVIAFPLEGRNSVLQTDAALVHQEA